MSMERCHSHIATALFTDTKIIISFCSLKHDFHAGEIFLGSQTYKAKSSRWLHSNLRSWNNNLAHAIPPSSHTQPPPPLLLSTKMYLSRYQRNGLNFRPCPWFVCKLISEFFLKPISLFNTQSSLLLSISNLILTHILFKCDCYFE